MCMPLKVENLPKCVDVKQSLHNDSNHILHRRSLIKLAQENSLYFHEMTLFKFLIRNYSWEYTFSLSKLTFSEISIILHSDEMNHN